MKNVFFLVTHTQFVKPGGSSIKVNHPTKVIKDFYAVSNCSDTLKSRLRVNLGVPKLCSSLALVAATIIFVRSQSAEGRISTLISL